MKTKQGQIMQFKSFAVLILKQQRPATSKVQKLS